MKKYLKKINNTIDKIKNISNNIIMRYEDLKWMQTNGLFTSDQILMITSKCAFASTQKSLEWEFHNWKI